MADEMRIGLDELLRKARVKGDAGFLRGRSGPLPGTDGEMEVEQHVGAARHERTPERSGYRDGYRPRDWDTRIGTVELEVPRVRDGSYFPSLLEPRRSAEWALAAVVQEAAGLPNSGEAACSLFVWTLPRLPSRYVLT